MTESFDTIVTAIKHIQPLTKELRSPNMDIMTAYKEAREVARGHSNTKE